MGDSHPPSDPCSSWYARRGCNAKPILSTLDGLLIGPLMYAILSFVFYLIFLPLSNYSGTFSLANVSNVTPYLTIPSPLSLPFLFHSPAS